MRLLDSLLSARKYYVWGTGKYLEDYYYYIPKTIECFIDNSIEKQGAVIHEKKICSPGILQDADEDEALIIVCCSSYYEIEEQIRNLGDYAVISIEDYILLKAVSCKKLIENNHLRSPYIVALAGIHALLEVNGSKRFIDGQRTILNRNGYDVIEACSIRFIDHTNIVYYCVFLNGLFYGVLDENEIIIQAEESKGIIIHAIYDGQEILCKLKEKIHPSIQILYYVHDYASVCKHRFLFYKNEACLLNDKLLCRQCKEYSNQIVRQKLHESFFYFDSVTVIVPSDDALSKISLFFPDSKRVVIPHLKYKLKRDQFCRINEPIKIGFLGQAVMEKGWAWFEQVAETLHDQYLFYFFGNTSQVSNKNIKAVDVTLQNGMCQCLKKEKIDIACILSMVSETYCYTYYEALESSCYILTTNRSGNVYRAVLSEKTGKSFSSCDEMVMWLKDIDSVRKEIINNRVSIYDCSDNDSFLELLGK